MLRHWKSQLIVFKSRAEKAIQSFKGAFVPIEILKMAGFAIIYARMQYQSCGAKVHDETI